MSIALAVALAAQVRVLTLAEAVQTALAHQPQLAQAQANADAAWARVAEARSAVLPQLVGTASYQRTTANFVARPGLLPSQVNMMGSTSPTFDTFNFWNFGLTLNQYIFDFRAPFVWKASRKTAEAQGSLTSSTRLTVVFNVRAAFFNARAQKALALVALDNLNNQARHLAQIRGFVEEGVRPEIDLAQAETDFANAEVLRINADNGYEIAKAQLNQAMGLERLVDYDVAADSFPAVEGETEPLQMLVAEAERSRPDLRSYEEQLQAQHATVAAARGGYGPSIGASMSLTDAGTAIDGLTWNWNVTVNATWTLFDGLFTFSQVKEAKANLRAIGAQRDSVRQQVVLEVSQARLQLRAAAGTLVAADKAVVSARLQLGLAEGRYQQGVGSIIELGDAQLAYTQTSAQRVQAEYNLATARAQLLKALGRP